MVPVVAPVSEAPGGRGAGPGPRASSAPGPAAQPAASTAVAAAASTARAAPPRVRVLRRIVTTGHPLYVTDCAPLGASSAIPDFL
ncbi:hypothetical protein GCM10010238_23110 [Streptomyces griseoviridis]|uniref:Uncharacterized protein n=1 Tax=Streptomyces griseoviridis TaxID=45398 RepID=A0A918LD06_STRGD|nr:hypothetical protein GCM10010238_23110 [Streptomyces niveoruber]